MSEVDNVAVAICELLEGRPGHTYIEQPGYLIATLATELFKRPVAASASDHAYTTTAMAIRHLEMLEMIRVEREGDRRPERGNKLISIALTIE